MLPVELAAVFNHQTIGMKKAVVTWITFLLPFVLSAQNQDAPKLKFSGMVKTDFMFDSRQTVSAREGHFLLFPSPFLAGADGEDINAVSNFNILAIQTKGRVDIAGGEFFGMKASGAIEGEFFGHSNADVNGFRLRHAYVKLSNEKLDILMGQYWHPMFVTACYPGVYSVDTGSPFTPFNRSPQLRIETKGKTKIIAAASTQRDFASSGPAGNSSVYLRNAALPNLHVQLQHKTGNLLAGIGLDFKSLVPRTADLLGTATRTRVNSTTLIAYTKYTHGSFQWKAFGTLGQNLTDHLMLGGYAETGVDSLTGKYSYEPVKVAAGWTEFYLKGQKMEGGVFLGYTRNLGLTKPLAGKVYGLGTNIRELYRIAPRIGWIYGNSTIGLELEYTHAQYGKMDAKMTDVETGENGKVGNLRLLASVLMRF